ncbi:UDP-N-acetylmuramate dehydrogenase [Bacteroidales bacterium]|nr:UDP-N-acetylmuramate dehydrogenase [Bacteroidales bacterium]
MIIKEGVNLQKHHTFGIKVKAEQMLICDTLDDILEYTYHLTQHPDSNFLILGGGSNILFAEDYEGTIIKPDFKGITIMDETDEHIYLHASAGEDWDEFVKHCVDNNFGGIENLSLIPGNVGACPIQNIGAYGVEVKDTITEVRFVNIYTGKIGIFNNDECEFGYRTSVFKTQIKGDVIITGVTFKLTKNTHKLMLDYGDLKDRLKGKEHTLATVRDTIIAIREEKIPDPKKIGNAGSFFKNPVIEASHFDELKSKYDDIKGYETAEGIKVPAAWLIEKCGYKGKRTGDVGVNPSQALVLVNYGNASSKDILELANNIKKDVFADFNIQLDIEVNII